MFLSKETVGRIRAGTTKWVWPFISSLKHFRINSSISIANYMILKTFPTGFVMADNSGRKLFLPKTVAEVTTGTPSLLKDSM